MSEQPASKETPLEFLTRTPDDPTNPSLILIYLLNSKGIGIKAGVSDQSGLPQPAGYLAVFASPEGEKVYNAIAATDEFECIELASDPIINPEEALPKLYRLLEYVYLDQPGIRSNLTMYYWQNRLNYLEKEILSEKLEADNALKQAYEEAKTQMQAIKTKIGADYVRGILKTLIDQKLSNSKLS